MRIDAANTRSGRNRPAVSFVLVAVSAALLSAVPIHAAVAAEVSLVPDQPTAEVGSSVVVEIHGDFTDEATLGGGLDLTFDPDVFEFVSYLDGGAGDVHYQRDPDVGNGVLAGAAMGTFDGISGEVLLATLTFNVLPDAPAGLSTITVDASSGIAGPFASNVDFAQQSVTFSAAAVTIIADCSYTVAAPNGGENWNLNSVQAIRWHTTGSPCGSNVRLDLLDDGVVLSTLAASTPNDGAFTWHVDSIPPGGNYTIRVTDLDDAAYTDDSNAPFSIVDTPGFIFSTSFE